MHEAYDGIAIGLSSLSKSSNLVLKNAKRRERDSSTARSLGFSLTGCGAKKKL